MYRRLAFTLTIALSLTGCQTKGQTGALIGAGIGALAGQAIGGNTAGTLIGAGAGAGIGYIIGNEQDKKDARRLQGDSRRMSHLEVGSLGGTRWKIIKITAPEEFPEARSRIVAFSENGHVTTTTTHADGRVETSTEFYRVSGDTIIVNKPGYMVNYKFMRKGDTLTLEVKACHIILQRI